MTALPKAAPLSGTDPPAPNTDEAKSQHDQSGGFHVKHPNDQQVVSRINRQLGIWRRASSKAWRTRKRLEAARAKAAGEQP